MKSTPSAQQPWRPLYYSYLTPRTTREVLESLVRSCLGSCPLIASACRPSQVFLQGANQDGKSDKMKQGVLIRLKNDVESFWMDVSKGGEHPWMVFDILPS